MEKNLQSYWTKLHLASLRGNMLCDVGVGC